jgi:hypothetical protein
MGEPVRNPDTGGRSLADILREAGIENPSRSGRRRRWDDVDDAGIRQRSADADEGAARGAYGRRSTDLPLDRPATTGPGPRRERDLPRSGVPGSDHPAGRRDPRTADRNPVRDRELRRPSDPREGREQATGRVDPVGREAPARGRGSRDDADRGGRARRGDRARGRAERPAPHDPSSTAAIPGLRASRTPSVPGAPVATAAPTATPAPAPAVHEPEHRRAGRRSRSAALDPAPSTGPIPALHTDEATDPAGDRDTTPRALAWLRFGGELVVAAAAGVGIYFAFTVLWQTLPHLAVLVAPLAVTGLVAGVSAWRQRFGHAQLGARLLAVLVFAGTLLTVLPAAGLISRQ